jgi:hypothetical protein
VRITSWSLRAAGLNWHGHLLPEGVDPAYISPMAVSTSTFEINSNKLTPSSSTSHVAITLTDAVSIQQGKKTCEPCGRGGNPQVAVGWCVKCKVYLCQICNDHHKLLPLTSYHTILGADDVCSNVTSLVSADDTCLLHGGKRFKLYCTDHDAMCCTICVAVKHRTCAQVDTLESLVAGIRGSNEPEHLFERLAQYDRHVAALVSHDSQLLNSLVKQNESS